MESNFAQWETNISRFQTILCSTEDDSEELKEPLLGDDADSTRTSEAHSQQHDSQMGGSRALVPHSINRLNWEELWRVLWGNCCEGFAGILGEPLLPCALLVLQEIAALRYAPVLQWL